MKTTRRPRRLLPLVALAVAGCASPLSTLEPAGPAASEIALLWWVMFWASLAILLVTLGLALIAALRATGHGSTTRNRLLVIGGGVLWPTATITGLIVYAVYSGQHLMAVPVGERAFQIEITGHQFWWEVRYPDGPDGATIHDANEIHIPAGRPVDVHITTEDVIHSFWVPRLGGKLDAIPGITNVLRIEADAPGTYRGLCAEFCGAQHARMGFVVYAHEEEALAEELARIAEIAPAPEAQELDGAALFEAECATCHSADTASRSPGPAPNLARVAERSHIAAGWFPNDSDALRRWVREHQTLKPGNLMPVMDHLSDEEIDAVAAYLEAIP